MRRVEPSRARFGRAMSNLVRDAGNTGWLTSAGNPNWHVFANELDGVHYETLRKALAGEREPTPAVMEECARVLDIDPRYFVEYRLNEARELFDPRNVGLERALENFDRWASVASTGRRARRRA
jgi:hypothetical protein